MYRVSRPEFTLCAWSQRILTIRISWLYSINPFPLSQVLRALTISLLTFATSGAAAQGCCSGGSGSPIAGGASQGVLKERQLEISVNHQYFSTGRFLAKDRDTVPLLDNINSNYLYGRIAWGLTDKFTMSVESGYFINKTQYGRERKDTVGSSGIADLILFPRYCVLTRNTEETRNEITLGMGLKIPVGKYNDSSVVYRNPYTNQRYYAIDPPTVQPTNGSHDFIFYGFLYRGYVESKFRVFSSLIYIRKGWNPLGQRFGDYMSAGLFCGKTIGRNLSLTLQVRGEYVAKMQYHRHIDMLALYNIDVNSTGSRKVFIAPQLSFSAGRMIVYAMYEAPVYQYLNGTQVGSQHQFTTGLSYRFFVAGAD
jgi:hypothetical protein